MPTKPVFDPSSSKMKYACGVSGSGTNYDRIYEGDPQKKHLVFSNVPGCKGVQKAWNYGAQAVSLDSTIYFREMWGLEKHRVMGLKEIVTIWPYDSGGANPLRATRPYMPRRV